MADIAPASQPEASPTPPLPLPACSGDLGAEGSARTAWVLLYEASQDLVRAEAIVALLASEMEASRHQLYAAQTAGEFLHAVSERVAQARDMIGVAGVRDGNT
ncbi:hypothetical protein [Rubrivivax gelatinosus]|uniref:hypothetical protein n=1 Tax=Rubrivivax gelatinosus TaxID=28068 RepID=UPI0005C20FB9|nr:hypothetical protein [Rubrivivax gelatinosus]MBG6078988.1 hypothetical protein [Rubrivivax gelatinosus]